MAAQKAAPIKLITTFLLLDNICSRNVSTIFEPLGATVRLRLRSFKKWLELVTEIVDSC